MDMERWQERKQERSTRSPGVQIKINDNREVIFQGCRGVVEYQDHTVKLNAGRYLVAFEGRGLQIRWLDDYEVIINGFITSIQYLM